MLSGWTYCCCHRLAYPAIHTSLHPSSRHSQIQRHLMLTAGQSLSVSFCPLVKRYRFHPGNYNISDPPAGKAPNTFVYKNIPAYPKRPTCLSQPTHPPYPPSERFCLQYLCHCLCNNTYVHQTQSEKSHPPRTYHHTGNWLQSNLSYCFPS